MSDEADRIIGLFEDLGTEYPPHVIVNAKAAIRQLEAARDRLVAEKEDLKQRNKWLRDRWDLDLDQMRKRQRYEVLERLDKAESERNAFVDTLASLSSMLGAGYPETVDPETIGKRIQDGLDQTIGPLVKRIDELAIECKQLHDKLLEKPADETV